MNIKAQVVADSLSIHGDRLTTLLITFPRFILAEVNTHRMLSKNTSSSRAIPFEKMIQSVEKDPFIPIAWQKDHKGMQGTEYITDENAIKCLNSMWLDGKEQAIHTAKNLYRGAYKMVADRDVDGNLLRGLVSEDIPDTGVTKQICNRLLEPYMWTTMLITGSEEGWKNFFKLRCPQYYITDNQKEPYAKSWKELLLYHSDDKYTQIIKNNQENTLFKLKHNNGKAEIHMMTLAESIYDSMVNSTPKQLKPGEWHIPFYEQMDETKLFILADQINKKEQTDLCPDPILNKEFTAIKVSIAMAARTSYTLIGDEKELDYEKLNSLYEKLLNQYPPHSSPFEHCCQCLTEEEYNSSFKTVGFKYGKAITEKGWVNNYHGFKSYRSIIENY